MKDMKMRAWIIPTLTDSYSDGKIVKVNTIHLGTEKVQIGYKKIYYGAFNFSISSLSTLM